jgi:hypothetical protein
MTDIIFWKGDFALSFIPLLRSYLPRMRKIIGFVILIFSFLIGALSFGMSDIAFSGRIFMYVLFGIVPAFLGAILVMGKVEFKQFFWKFVRLYTFITLLIPVFLHLNDYIVKWKINAVSTPEDLYLDLFSTHLRLVLEIITFICVDKIKFRHKSTPFLFNSSRLYFSTKNNQIP